VKTLDFTIELLIKLGIIVILILAASIDHQYTFYTFVRWLVMCPSVYLLYKSYSEKEFGLVILFASIALLFNPFHKFGFQRDMWKILDYMVAGMILLTIIYGLVKRKYKN
jgi:hypothetical protein